jgi:hypothetical protein
MQAGAPEIMPPKKDRKSVKFGGNSAATTATTFEHVGSCSAASMSMLSMGAMMDGFALDEATHNLIKAMQTCMTKSLADDGILKRLVLSNLKSQDFAQAQKVRDET